MSYFLDTISQGKEPKTDANMADNKSGAGKINHVSSNNSSKQGNTKAPSKIMELCQKDTETSLKGLSLAKYVIMIISKTGLTAVTTK